MDHGRFNHRTLGRCSGVLRGYFQGDTRHARPTTKRQGTEKMNKIETEAELFRLKFKLEIIRTICPIVAIVLQIIILTQIF